MPENFTAWREGYFAALTIDEALRLSRYNGNPYPHESPIGAEWARGFGFGERAKKVVDEKYPVGSYS